MTSGINAKNHNKIRDITQYHNIIQKSISIKTPYINADNQLCSQLFQEKLF